MIANEEKREEHPGWNTRFMDERLKYPSTEPPWLYV